jgi:hypothetical protein
MWFAVVPLRILLVLLFAALVASQAILIPEGIERLVEQGQELDSVQSWLVAGCVLGVLCIQVVIACIWRLLSLVASDRIFGDAALVWVDVIVWAIAAAWLLLLASFVSVVLLTQFAGIGAAMLLMLFAGGVLGMLMIVMRSLLRQATSLRVEMESVI